MRTIRLLLAATVALASFFPQAGAAPFLYVTNFTSATVSVIDVATNTVTATIPVGSGPNGIASNAAGTQVYVALQTAQAVAVIDTATNTVITTVNLVGCQTTSGVSVDSANNRVYVTCSGSSDAVTVIDTVTQTQLTTFAVGNNPHIGALHAASARLYVPNQTDDSLSVIDTATNTVIATVPVGDFPNYTAVNPAGTRVYTTNATSNNISVIDTGTQTVVATFGVTPLPPPPPAGQTSSLFGIEVSADGSRLYIAHRQTLANFIDVLDANTGAILTTIPTGNGPRGTAISADGSRLAVVNQSANSVALIDLATNTTLATITVGSQPLNVAMVPGPPPTVTINQAGAQADPSLTAPINFTVVFSEPVTGFTGTDVSFAGSTAGGTLAALVTGGPSTYNVAVSGMTSAGTVVASVPAGAATSSFGASSLASTSTDNTVTAAFSVTTYTAPSATGSGMITASFTGGGLACTYTVSQFIPLTGHAASPPAGTAPAGVTFPHGLFDFTTSGCTPGSTITMTITYPAALAAGTQYWKYGPTPGNAAPHWYVLPAAIAGNTATFSITDGGTGDDDLAANGTIVDQGGPGGGGGGGGGGSGTSVPTLTEWMLLLLSALVLGLGTRRLSLGSSPGLRQEG